MIFLIMVVVVLAFVALWNFDLHKIIYIKSLTRNAGDGAALAAARWQGISLNLLGELNVAQAVAINNALLANPQAPDFSEARAIADLQARVCFAGPMLGFAAAQQAAKNNSVYVDTNFTREVLAHVSVVQSEYPLLYTPPYATAWSDYAGMINTVAGDGIAALPGAQSPYASMHHMLLNIAFYQAIASQNWCWFYNNAYTLLQSYGGWQTWPPLPPIAHRGIMSSEYFPLNVTTESSLDDLEYTLGDSAATILQKLGAAHNPPVSLLSDVTHVGATWYAYDPSYWTTWDAIIQSNRQANAGPFPFINTIRPQYNYGGADAGLTVRAEAPPTLFNQKQYAVTWSVAAKPFGYLDGPVPPQTYGIILPAFHDVRLIPVDAAISPFADNAFSDGASWIEHITSHLPIYMQSGPAGIQGLAASCGYCQQLVTWENPGFRQTGLTWLQEYSTNCVIHGGPGSSGGASHGH